MDAENDRVVASRVASAADAVRPPDVPAEFNVDLGDVSRFVGRARIEDPAAFLDPGGAADRYVVIAVDPAGGGRNSQEAFVVFLTRGHRFALLGARVIEGKNERIALSTVPMIFVLSLLETVRTVRTMLEAVAARPFRMPPVLVVIENNFAYGAATYIQLTWFLQQQQSLRPELRDVRLVFATPVYAWLNELRAAEADLQTAIDELAQRQADRARARAGVDAVWIEKGRRVVGLNRAAMMAAIRNQIAAEEDAGVWQAEVPTDAIVDRVVANIVGELRIRDEDHGRFMEAWRGRLEEVLRAEFEAFRRLRIAGDRVKALTQMVKRARRGDGTGREANDLFFTAPWPPGHTVGPGDRIVFPQGHWWQAGKGTFGENTDAREKVRGFRHWLHLIHEAQQPNALAPRLLLLDLPPARRIDPADRVWSPAFGEEALAALVYRPGAEEPLHEPAVALRGIFEQWKALRVHVTGAPPAVTVVRVEGKQPVPDGGGDGPVSRDDLWMAFTVGLQWCARFTRLLPSERARRQLVEYMVVMRRTAFEALRGVINDASAQDEFGNVIRPDQGGGRGAAAAADDPPVALAAADPAPAPDPAGVVPVGTTDALVAVYAVVSAATRFCAALQTQVRSLLLSFAVNGWSDPAFYRITARRVRRRVPRIQQNRFQELVLSALQASVDPAETTLPLERLRRTFGRHSVTLRALCLTAPGLRFGWPGWDMAAPSDRGPDATLSVLVDGLWRLRELVERVVHHHRAQHPLLSTGADAAAAIPLTVGRIHAAALDLQRLCRSLDGGDHEEEEEEEAHAGDGLYVAGDPRGRQVMLTYHVNQRRQLAETLAVATENGVARNGPSIPLTPFTLYTELAHIGAFLRRLTLYHRPRLIPLLRSRDPTHHDCDPLGPDVGAYPQIRLRMSERWLINWRHVHRVMWPAQHAALLAGDGEAEAPTVVVFRASVTVSAAPLRPPQAAAPQ